MNRRLPYPALAVALSATLLLGGCSFRIADPDGGPQTPVASSPAPTASFQPDDNSDDSFDDSERDRLENLVTVTLQCEPGLEIDQPGAVVEIDGDCDTVTVSGDAAVVIADDIQSLVVTADGAVVYVDSLGAVRVSGDANTVRWDDDLTPTVDNRGDGNTLGRDN